MLTVRFQDVCKSFATEAESPSQMVIHRLNLSIDAGESVALMGPSGSGKSTILNLVSGLDSPSSGEITIGNTNLHKLSADEKEAFRLNSISYVFQSFHLLPTLTTLENCTLVAFEQNKRQASEILKSALQLLEEIGLADAAHKYPQQLSGGMQARVALARALISKPNLILADEPTGNLDSQTGNIVLDLLFKAQQEQKFTLIMVTHDSSAATRANRIVHLRDGHIVS